MGGSHPEAEEILLFGFKDITHLELDDQKFDSFAQFVILLPNSHLLSFFRSQEEIGTRILAHRRFK